MKEYIVIGVSEHIEDDLKEKWGEPCHLPDKMIGYTFDSTSLEYEEFKNDLKKLAQEKIFYIEIYEKEYKFTEREKLNSKFLELILDISIEEYLDEESLVFPPLCNTCNRRQGLPKRKGPIEINIKDARNYDIMSMKVGYPFGIVISKRLKKLLEANSIKGCKFGPIIDHKNSAVTEEYYELRLEVGIGHVLPLTPVIREGKCPTCNYFENFLLRGLLFFSESTYKGHDIFLTKDIWGSLDDVDSVPWAWPAKIITNKVYRLFLSQNIKAFSVEPCFLL